MQTLTVKKHKELMTARWQKHCDEWDPYAGGFPQLAMYIFDKNYGYVTFGRTCHIWRRTKRESIKEYTRMTGDKEKTNDTN